MPITKTGAKFIKSAARWHDYIAKLSPENYARIRAAGLAKPLAKIIERINTGSENIAKKYNYKIDKNPDKSWENSFANIATNRLVIGTAPSGLLKNKESNELMGAIAARHEALEAGAAEKLKSIFDTNQTKFLQKSEQNFNSLPLDLKLEFTQGQIPVFENLDDTYKKLFIAKKPGFLVPDSGKSTGHLAMDVLLKERKLLDRIPQRYDPAMKLIRDARKSTGETQFMDITGGYDPASLKRFDKSNAKNTLSFGLDTVPIEGADVKSLRYAY